MKKLILLTVVCLLTVSPVFSQNNDQITKQKGRYYQNGEVLKRKELKEVLKSDPESAPLMKSSGAILTTGYLVESGAIVAVYLLTGSPLGVLAGVAVAVPFIVVSGNKLNKAVEVYNSNRKENTPVP